MAAVDHWHYNERWRCSKNKRAHIKTGPTCRHLVEEFSINKYTILSSPFWAEFIISWIFHPRGRLVRYLGLYTHSCIENVKMATKRISTSYSAKVHLTLHQLRGGISCLVCNRVMLFGEDTWLSQRLFPLRSVNGYQRSFKKTWQSSWLVEATYNLTQGRLSSSHITHTTDTGMSLGNRVATCLVCGWHRNFSWLQL